MAITVHGWPWMLLATVLGGIGCGEAEPGRSTAAQSEGLTATLVSLDAGAPLARADLLRPEQRSLICASLPSFLCGGGCEEGTGCCVTGARPNGVCAPSGACSSICEGDCTVAAYYGGPSAAAQCETQCTFVSASAACNSW